MLPRLIFLILIAIGVGVGGYFSYQHYATLPTRPQPNAQIEKIQESISPTPSATASTVPTPTPTQKAAPVKQTYVPAPPINCIKMNIREGEFASNKCYLPADYDDLNYYLNTFNNATFSYNGAVSSMEITCNGSDFFKNDCEKDKKTKSDSQANIDKYRGIVKGIIAKGH